MTHLLLVSPGFNSAISGHVGQNGRRNATKDVEDGLLKLKRYIFMAYTHRKRGLSSCLDQSVVPVSVSVHTSSGQGEYQRKGACYCVRCTHDKGPSMLLNPDVAMGAKFDQERPFSTYLLCPKCLPHLPLQLLYPGCASHHKPPGTGAQQAKGGS